MGHRVTALKELRRELGDTLADGLSITHVPLGAQVNPPAVVVDADFPYLTPEPGYCIDGLSFVATIITKPGDPAAVRDALDDIIDAVRQTLARTRYSLREVSGRVDVSLGESVLPAVNVTVRTERDTI